MVAESHETSSFGGDPICDTKKPICLCLSGGGFRATFFHLGVIIALRQLKLMSAIGHIVSVSGGSILAGHLACYWKDYQDDNDYSFLKRVTEILKFGRCDLRGKILRRMIFGMFLPGLRRRQQLLKYYSRLYGNRVLGDTRIDGPAFHFLATSITTGRLWSFFYDGVITYDPETPTKEESFGGSHIFISLAVAASSAFPPFFPPILVTRKEFLATEKEFPISQFLTDGGVFDNVGIYKARQIASQGTINSIIVSDASSPFDWRTEDNYWGTLNRNIRATSILMNRVASLEQQRFPLPTLNISIQSTVQQQDIEGVKQFRPQCDSIQKMTKFVRTDLDEFDYATITALVRHGHEVTLKAILNMVPKLPIDNIEEPCLPGWPDYGKINQWKYDNPLDSRVKLPNKIRETADSLSIAIVEDLTETDRKTETHLERAKHRSVLRAFWNPSDPISWFFALLFLCVIYLLLTSLL